MFRLQPGPSYVRNRVALHVLFARGEDAAVIQSTAPCCRSGDAVPRTLAVACAAAAIPASGTAPCGPATVTARAPAAITAGVVVVVTTVTFVAFVVAEESQEVWSFSAFAGVTLVIVPVAQLFPPIPSSPPPFC